MKILRSIATVGGYTAVSRVFGLGREILMSHVLGVGMVSDAFWVAFKFPNFFRRFFAEGAFNAAFVPMFAGTLATEGISTARLLAERVLSVLVLVLIGLVIFIEFGVPWLIYGLAPGFATTPERLDLAIQFIRITFPYILFISLAALLSGVLNSLDRFAAAAAAPILLNILMILALIVYSSINLSAGHALSWAVFIAGVIQLLWLYIACKRAGFPISIKFPHLTPEVKKVVTLMIPGAFGAGVMQVNLLMDMILASFLPLGAISYLCYADRLNQLPLSIFGVAIGTALLPLLSRQLRAGEVEKALKSQNMAVEVALQLTLPAAVGLIVLAYPIINLIYGHGHFTKMDVAATAPALAAFATGLPAYVLGKVFVTSFFARQDTKTPVKIAILCVATNLFLNLILMRFFAHVGMAIATSIAAWLNTGLLVLALRRRGLFSVSRHLRHLSLRLCLVCAMMAGGIFLLLDPLEPLLIGGIMHQISGIATLVTFGLVLFIGFGQWVGAFNIQALVRTWRQRS